MYDLNFNDNYILGFPFHTADSLDGWDKDEFKITGVIIDKEKLNERIKNPETKIEGEKYEGKFLKIIDNAIEVVKSNINGKVFIYSNKEKLIVKEL